MEFSALSQVKSSFDITRRDAGDFAKFKVGPMTAEIEWYYIERLGNLAILKAKAMGGLMVMDTVVINPVERDLPLFSADAISAMGKNTLLVELYDTMISPSGFDSAKLDEIKSGIADIPDKDLGTHWYDGIRLGCSFAKCAGKAAKPQLEKAIGEMLAAYLEQANAAAVLDEDERAKKCAKATGYVDGLLANGGPATDAFVKGLGAERAEKFLRDILFSTTHD